MFLGIELDPDNRLARLPIDKVRKHQTVMQDGIDKDHLYPKHFQSLNI